MTDPHPPFIAEPSLAGALGQRHGFFTRRGGVSKGVYDSLNMGFGSDDDREAVAENRRRAMACFGLDGSALNTVYQIHGTNVVHAERCWNPADAPRADAQVTDRPGVAIGVLTADCVPVLFAGSNSAGRPVIGVAHAGWRGALSGVLAETVEAMERLGARRDSILAAVGPCIAQDSYEVGAEFPAPFIDQDQENHRFFKPGDRDGHSMFDISGYVEGRLAALSIGAVGVVAADTCAEPERFFSYRRKTLTGESDYGRELSVIVIGA